jgi:hypothetical protein
MFFLYSFLMCEELVSKAFMATEFNKTFLGLAAASGG